MSQFGKNPPWARDVGPSKLDNYGVNILTFYFAFLYNVTYNFHFI